ncbi:B12-binding domain-containing radical SAM protein [Candidatus Woesearchaeota archaeon]|nr:B12-binding domain-containing radical SAM protein [Candidatus Woesearchaeota archaeon]
MNILLVYPKYPDTFWSFKHVLKFISKKAAFPPLGLMTVAAMLPETWEKKLIDLNVTELTADHLEWADMVFIGAMIVQKDSAREIIARCKRLGKKIVAGGPFFTTQYNQFTDVDHFVLNEAEVTLPLFLKDLEEGSLKKIYTSTERPDITKTPLPMWSLINFKDYATLSVQYSRGCPFNCEFCDIVIMNGRIPRNKSPEQMITEFQALYNAGWRGPIFIVDDNFIGNTLNVKKMLPELITWQKAYKYPFSFFTEASTNLAADPELMQLMSAANFYKVFLGIETPSLDGLKECDKFQNVSRDLADAVRTIHQNGMQVMGGFIVGFDSDTENIFEAQIKFIQQTGVVTAMVGLLTALPQTRLWHRLKAEGRLVKESSGGNTDGTLNFVPKLNKETLLQGYKRILSTIYSRRVYYKRIHTFIKSYKPTVRTRISKSDMLALFRSMWNIGIISNARLHYWKLLSRTFVTKIKAFPTAVELAIIGQHFEKIVAKTVAR